jgi:hypothetical protein
MEAGPNYLINCFRALYGKEKTWYLLIKANICKQFRGSKENMLASEHSRACKM